MPYRTKYPDCCAKLEKKTATEYKQVEVYRDVYLVVDGEEIRELVIGILEKNFPDYNSSAGPIIRAMQDVNALFGCGGNLVGYSPETGPVFRR